MDGTKLRRDSGLVTCKVTTSRISHTGNLPQPRRLGPSMWGKKIGKDSKTTLMCSGEFLWEAGARMG